MQHFWSTRDRHTNTQQGRNNGGQRSHNKTDQRDQRSNHNSRRSRNLLNRQGNMCWRSRSLDGWRSYRWTLRTRGVTWTRHQPSSLPHSLEAKKGPRLLAAWHPSVVITLPLSQNRERYIRGDLNNFIIIRVNPSSRRLDSRQWHDPTSKSGLLDQGPPCRDIKISKSETKVISSQNPHQTQKIQGKIFYHVK